MRKIVYAFIISMATFVSANANTINIEWDYGNGDTSISTCTVGSDIKLPDEEPIKTGYKFIGWRVSMCNVSVLDADVGGGYFGFIQLNGTPSVDNTAYRRAASNYGLTDAGTWANEFDYGKIHGVAKCSAKTGNNSSFTWPWDTLSAWSATDNEMLSAGNGKYCWCKMTDYEVSMSTCPVNALWVFRNSGGSENECNQGCAGACGDYARIYSAMRGALFGWVRNKCGTTYLNPEIAGGNFGFVQLNGNASTDNGGNRKPADYYGLTESGTWITEFIYGKIHGQARCSAQGGNTSNFTWPSSDINNWSATDNELNSAGDGKFCWCKMNGFSANGAENMCASQSAWIFRNSGGSLAACEQGCTGACAEYVRNYGTLRAAMFGQSN